MENSSAIKQDDKQSHPSPINSPNSSTNSCNNGGVAPPAQVLLHHNNLAPSSSPHLHHHQQQKPIITTRSENLASNPYPTTFVQADTTSFKQVVQMLTGSTETTANKSAVATASKPDPQPVTKNPIPPRRQQGFKLYERRNSSKSFKISPVLPGFSPAAMNQYSPGSRKPEILSPSILDFPSLVLSPVTPLMTDPFNRSPHHNHHHHHHHHHHNLHQQQQQQVKFYHQQQQQQQQIGFCRSNGGMDSSVAVAEEEKAIAEKGFYLHKSPATTPRDSEPRLLPLFPVTSPRVSGSS